MGMKKPEEINIEELKTGIERCIIYLNAGPREESCDICPYIGKCRHLEKDALALIRQLEAENAELLVKTKQLERERDAAVFDIRKMGRSRLRCITCEKEKDDRCSHGHGNCYEWRGPCEENGGVA